ncbi:MAG: transcriptional repressor [Eubacteriales bacterium]|nr:transcriptional repressor [Eubacteriales bacterium]MDD4475812.1 transcriptional repressor [Eubacteriales bacterium]
MNYSKQRELIYNEIKKSVSHPSASEIYSHLKSENPSLSLGTVYRNLKLLSEDKRITKLSSPNKPDRFDGRTVEHYHYYCTQCSGVFDADDISPDEIKKIIPKQKHQIISYELSIYCICENCLTNETSC